MRIIAHRGGSAHAPENTIAAFDNTIAMGVRDFEFDLRLSNDGELFVIHDATLDRTTNGAGPVAEASGAHIRSLDAGSWFAPEFQGERVPAFREVLRRYDDDVTLHIEIKDSSPAIAKAALHEIADADAFRRCWVTSFHPEVIDTLRAGAKDIRLARLMRRDAIEEVGALQAARVQMACPHAGDVTPELVAAYHEGGFLVRPWGLKGSVDLLRFMAELGTYGSTFSDLNLARDAVGAP